MSDAPTTTNARFRRYRILIVVAASVVFVLIGVSILIATSIANNGRSTLVGSTMTPTSSSSSSPSVPQPSSSGEAPAPEHSIDPSFGQPVAETVGSTATAQLPGLMTARIAASKAITAEATQAGEISGPAIQVIVELVNGSATAVSVNTVTVNGYYGSDLTPASPIVPKSTSLGFSGTVEPGAKATGTYVFSVPKESQSSFVLTVSVVAGGPIAVFK